MDIKKVGIIVGILAASGVSLWGIAEAAINFKLDDRYVEEIEIASKLDHRYITVAGYKDIKKTERQKFLTEQIFIITFKITKGTATDLEKALIERYKAELTTLNSAG